MRRAPRSVMIFAAGFGTRMGELTRDWPKPLIEVAGKPLLDHALDQVSAAGIEKVVANVHYLPDVIVPELEARNISVSLEAPEILDTGGGLRKARSLFDEDAVFTLNSDAVWRGPNPLMVLGDAWERAELEGLLLCVPRDRAIAHEGRGDFLLDRDGTLTRGPGDVYTGVQILSLSVLDRYEEGAFSLNAVWDDLIARGTLRGVTYPGHWCDVGHPEGIRLAENLLEAGDV